MSGRSILVPVLVVAILTTGACASTPDASFEATGPCTADGAAAGAYPDLEALVPTAFEDKPPDTLDSGRNCSAEALGSLGTTGIVEIRYAGGTWAFGGIRAAALAVFTAPGLTADAMADFYAVSARGANRTRVTGESSPTLAGRAVRRLDTVTGPRQQTVVVWPASRPDTVNVVITNDLPDPKIEAAVAAFDGE